MKKKNKDYIIILSLFLCLLFSSKINFLFASLHPHLDSSKIVNNYNTYLEEEYKKLSKFSLDNKLNLEISKIKYRNLYDYMHTLTIYKGYKDGISLGDAVLTPDGLVGVIAKTYEHTSVVNLLTNKNTSISVQVGNSMGILCYREGRIIIKNILNTEEINVNDEIYTSGLGNLPESIYIGEVSKVESINNNLEKVAYVNLKVSLDELNYLYIWRQND